MNNIYIAIDGDSIGKLLEKYIFSGNENDLHRFSSSIQEDIDEISNIIISFSGTIIMKGGDNILAKCDMNSVNDILKQVQTLNIKRDYHFSTGLGDTITASYMALKYAKLSHHNVVKCFIGNDDLYEVLTP